jgi:hypothetical protein
MISNEDMDEDSKGVGPTFCYATVSTDYFR